MPRLRQIADQYDEKASHLAIRYEGKLGKVVGYTRKDGKRVSVTLADVIQNYRTNADRVRALIFPEDEVKTEETTQWQLEADEGQSLLTSKVTAKDKVATPQELLKKAK